jgi:hypothetical protein
MATRARKIEQPKEPAYDSDYVSWIETQRRHIAARRADLVDADNLAEELRDMGNSERDAVESHMTVLMEHLLKLQHSRDTGPRNGWLRTVREQRRQLGRKLARSPSLRPWAQTRLAECYADARGDAALDESIDVGTLPPTCPYALEQLLDAGFAPGATR